MHKLAYGVVFVALFISCPDMDGPLHKILSFTKVLWHKSSKVSVNIHQFTNQVSNPNISETKAKNATWSLTKNTTQSKRIWVEREWN